MTTCKRHDWENTLAEKTRKDGTVIYFEAMVCINCGKAKRMKEGK